MPVPQIGFWQDYTEWEERRSAHHKPYINITGEQQFMERAMDAWKLDTGIGQMVDVLQRRFEHDAVGAPADWGYNPFMHGDLTGYEDHMDEFLRATSDKEVEIIKEQIDENMSIRRNIDGHLMARFMGNALDPINLIPIPIARGIGFARGARRGAVGVAAPLALSEGVRASIDPTNPFWEPVLAVSGGAIFGGALGGLAGVWRPRDFEAAERAWFEMEVGGTESHNKIHSTEGYNITNTDIKPLPDEKIAAHTDVEHLSTFVGRSIGETQQEYDARLLKIVDDGLYTDFVNVARKANPDAFLPTYTGLEKISWVQAPYFLLKNNKFDGQLGNDLRRLGDMIGGSAGLTTKGAAGADDAANVALGVYNKAQMHSIHFTKAKNEMFNAYKAQQGRPETAGDLSAGQEIWQGMADFVTGKTKHYEEFLDSAFRVYVRGGQTDDPHVGRAVKGIKEYFFQMGKLGVEVGVFGTVRLHKRIMAFEEMLTRNRGFLRDYVSGDPLSKNEAFRLGLEGRTAKSTESLQKKVVLRDEVIAKARSRLEEVNQRLLDLESSYDAGRGWTQKQLDYYHSLKEQLEGLRARGGFSRKEGRLVRKLQKEIPEKQAGINKRSEERIQIEEYLADPEAFMAKYTALEAEGWRVTTKEGGVQGTFEKIYNRHKSLNADKKRMDEWGAYDKDGNVKLIDQDNLPNADKVAYGHMPRIWRRETVIKHREELRKILERWYTKDGGQTARAEETIDSILKERKPGLIKRVLEQGMRENKAPDEAIGRMAMEVDAIFKSKKPPKGMDIFEYQASQIAAAKNIMTRYMNTYGFGDDLKSQVNIALTRIENLASNGMPEGFGASTSLMERRLDIPSELLIKGDGQGDSIATVDFIETNTELIMRNYHRRMSASVEMAREFGDPNMSGTIRTFQERIDLRALRAETPEEAAAIRVEGARNIQAMKDLSEKVLGVYGIPDDPMSVTNRAIMLSKNWMVLSLMGQAAIAALADVGRGVMSVGFKNAFEGALRRFGEGASDFHRAGKEVTGQIGEAAEGATHGRFQVMFDIEGYTMGETFVEKFFQGGVNKMFILNILSPYTDMMKRFYGGLIVSDMLKISVRWANDYKWEKVGDEWILKGIAGELNKAEKGFLKRNGIGIHEAIAISNQWKKHGDEGQFLHFSNVQAWDDLEAAITFKGAAITEINNAVITPGVSEKLNFMSTPAGSMMMQFRSFAMSATSRTLMAGMQQRDAKVLHGILATVAMGYIVDLMKSPSYDKRDLTSLDRLVQAVDYSGVTGILFDMNNMVEFATAHRESMPHLGIRPMFGVESPWMSKTKVPSFAQRVGQPFGPSVSLWADMVQSLFDPDAQGSDMVRSVRRLLPFNNLLYVDWLFDRMQRNIGTAVDAKPYQDLDD
jgi:hypothetical protein